MMLMLPKLVYLDHEPLQLLSMPSLQIDSYEAWGTHCGTMTHVMSVAGSVTLISSVILDMLTAAVAGGRGVSCVEGWLTVMTVV